MWIEKFKNDLRDYIGQEKTIGSIWYRDTAIYLRKSKEAEYKLLTEIRSPLCHEVDELTGQQCVVLVCRE